MLAWLYVGAIHYKDTDWSGKKPFFWLLQEAEYESGSATADALPELLRRLDAGELRPKQIAEACATAYRIHGDESIPWDVRWLKIARLAREQGFLPEDDWRAFLLQEAEGAVQFEVRRRITLGDPIPYRVTFDDRRGLAELGYWIEFRCSAVSFPSAGITQTCDQVIQNANSLYPTSLLSNRFSDHLAPAPEILHRIQPGEHTILFSGEFLVKQFASEPVRLGAGKRQHEAKFQMLPAGQSSVRLKRDPAWRPRISLHPLTRRMAPGEKEDGQIWVQENFESRYVSFGFDVYLLFDGAENRIGSFAGPKSESQSKQLSIWQLPVEFMAAPGRAHVEFRPNPQLIENTVDIFEMWGEPIVVTDVQFASVDNSESQ